MSTPRQTNRRQFLEGESAAAALADLAQAALGERAPENVGSPSAAPRDGALLRVGRQAMACEFEILLNAGEYAFGMVLALAALDLVDQVEEQLSVFRDQSEVSRLNRSAADQPVEVEPRLFALLSRAAEISAETGGAYDITAGPLSKVWGFHRRAGRLPGENDLAAAMRSVGTRHLELDPARQTVRFAREGMEINLGSIGKGYALDRAAGLFAGAAIDSFLIHAGHSSLLARGARGADAEPREGWWVKLGDPLRPTRRLAEIRLRNKALATSAATTQFFFHQGRRYGHLLDPRTGRPAEGTLSATVVADSAATADALSTAFYVLGPERSLAYCDEHPEIGAVILRADSADGRTKLLSRGLADDELREL